MNGVSLRKGQSLTLSNPSAEIFLYKNDHHFRLKSTSSSLKTAPMTPSASNSTSKTADDGKPHGHGETNSRKRRFEEEENEPSASGSDIQSLKKKPAVSLNSWLNIDRDESGADTS